METCWLQASGRNTAQHHGIFIPEKEREREMRKIMPISVIASPRFFDHWHSHACTQIRERERERTALFYGIS